jgi:hypothetical protein
MRKLTIFAIAFLSTRDIRYSVIIVFLYSILFNPCGLAYKIMKKTQAVMNPLTIFQNLSNDDITSIEIKKKPKLDKIKVSKIKIN